jgi:hypothetical protein
MSVLSAAESSADDFPVNRRSAGWPLCGRAVRSGSLPAQATLSQLASRWTTFRVWIASARRSKRRNGRLAPLQTSCLERMASADALPGADNPSGAGATT